MYRLNEEALRSILESAILAPSADNHHRVRFKVDGNVIRITASEAALPTRGGYRRALYLMSLGALTENLVIAASCFGALADVVLFPDPGRPERVLDVTLQTDSASADPLGPFIPARHTNRRIWFRGPGMSAAEREAMQQAVAPFPAVQLNWLDEPALRRQALRLMRLAETERFRTQVLHEELFSAIRFEAGWHELCPEGLPPGALGVERPSRPLFALLRHWPVMHLANRVGAHHFLGWRACDLPCRLAPNLAMLAAKGVDDASVLEVGRAFQRIWLTATTQTRVLQPMPASALFALGGASAEGVPVTTQRSLEEGWRVFWGGAFPLMVFRMGFAKPLAVVAGRPELGAYLDT